jgi:hypothetical protein
MSFNYILTGNTTFEAVDKINENFSGVSNYWSAGTGNNSLIATNDTNNISSNDYSFVGGQNNNSNGLYSFAYGKNVSADGNYSFATGESGSSVGDFSFTSGLQTTAIGKYSFAVGNQTTASGDYSFASGFQTKATSPYSHVEGYKTTASGSYSFAGGYNSIASNAFSFVFSKNSKVTGARSVVIGGQNITGTTDNTVYIPSLRINTVDDSVVNSTKVLSTDMNGNIKTRGITFPDSFFTWNIIENDDVNQISLNNGYVSRRSGAYSLTNYNTFYLPTFLNNTERENANGKKVKIANDSNTVTRIYINENPLPYDQGDRGIVFYSDGWEQEYDKYFYLLEYEYIELTLSSFQKSNNATSSPYDSSFWIVSKFIKNSDNGNGGSSPLDDRFIYRFVQ